MENIKQLFQSLQPAVAFCSLRYVSETSEQLMVRQNILQAPSTTQSRGAMITVIDRGGYGYAATSDISSAGLRDAMARATQWAHLCAQRAITNFSALTPATTKGEYYGPGADTSAGATSPTQFNRKDIITALMQESADCKLDERIVDWYASLNRIHTEQLFLSTAGAEIYQAFHYIMPSLAVTANEGSDTQTRSLGGQYNGFCRQGGDEVLHQAQFYGAGKRVAQEALDLLHAPNCPSGKLDLLLLPEQMMLQIHESIGHPLELDRILGDERNFAGTSFVTQNMFGHFQYGSPLLNVTYDPTHSEQFASYAWDDDGQPTAKTFVIRNGVLQRPLGGQLSQIRAGMDGVANSRACDWNRPPIDRMANLNIEPGSSSLEQMISSVERGVLMDTNVSWSIDDSRNKFQFGCEYGQLIENGELKGLVKNPNYRGISESFWRSLKAVGDASTFAVMGTPFCGKGEPSQVIRVGHASPACLFGQVDIFGGE